jgi:hypothetical protein
VRITRVRIDCRPADQPRQRALLDAQHLGLLSRQASTAEPPRQRCQLVLVGLAVFLHTDFGIADARQRAAPETAKHIGDAPHGKGDDQQAEQCLRQPVHGAASHCIKHVSFPDCGCRRGQGFGVAGRREYGEFCAL